jgi:hypothetical protein
LELTNADRLHARLFAINLRLAELDHELQRTQVRVNSLESQLEDARLAQLMGQEAGDPSELAPELERSRGALESQQEMVAMVRHNQWKARVAYTVARARERLDTRRTGSE